MGVGGWSIWHWHLHGGMGEEDKNMEKTSKDHLILGGGGGGKGILGWKERERWTNHVRSREANKVLFISL